MKCYGPIELAASFRTVRSNTLRIAEDIAEEHYAFSATPETRTVAQTLVHIAVSPRIHEQVHCVERRVTLEGFDFLSILAAVRAEEQATRSKTQIIALLRENGQRFAGWLESVTDDYLAERVAMRPGTAPPDKSRFEMLLAVKEHEMHHRGQLMVLERMIGVTPHLTLEFNARVARMAAAGANVRT